jgi:Fe-S cluster assembly protein SufD
MPAGWWREEDGLLYTFTADGAASLPGPAWLRRRRTDAFEELETMPLPSEKEEVWRYTPIDELRLDDFAPVAAGARDEAPGLLGSAFIEGVAADLAERSAFVSVVDGRPVSVERTGLPEGVVLGPITGTSAGTGAGPITGTGAEADVLGRVLSGGDALVRLNDAFHPDALVVDVPAGVVVDAPIVVVHWCGGRPPEGASGTGTSGPAPASFPRTLVRLGRGASASVVEVIAGAAAGHAALVVPVTELAADDGAQLSYLGLQVLGTGAWHIGRLAASAGRDATLRTFTVGLGGAYDRLRTDAVASGPGASTALRSAYLGTGDQVHDVRTLQDHAAPHTTSDLLCKGAVAGRSRSVYSGLIRVRRGAVRTEAFQTNHNLVLDARAHADSVPNLDIEENDVRCSHASTVGPVDEDQRYYLESRGVPPERAERLIVLGFFDDIVLRAPVPAAVGRLRREVGLRLADALALGAQGAAGTGADDEVRVPADG